MARDTIGLRKTFQFDTAVLTPNLIVALSTVNAGNVTTATQFANNIIGVVEEPTDLHTFASVQLSGIASVQVGSTAIVAGNTIGSDASGNATPITPNASGTAVKGKLGLALNSAAAGAWVDVLLAQGTTE